MSLGPCIGSLNGAPCRHGSDGGPADAVILEDGRAMCADHRRGYRMAKTRAAKASKPVTRGEGSLEACTGGLRGDACRHGEGGQPAAAVEVLDGRAVCWDHARGHRAAQTHSKRSTSGIAMPGDATLDVKCVGSKSGAPCRHGSDGGPAFAVIEIDGRALCAHHRRGYRAALTNSGNGWEPERQATGRVLYAVVAVDRPLVKIGKAMATTLTDRVNGAAISGGEAGFSTKLAAWVPLPDRADRGRSGALALTYEHAVRLVVATMLDGRIGAYKTEWIEFDPALLEMPWEELLQAAIAFVDDKLAPLERTALASDVRVRRRSSSRVAGVDGEVSRG